jgi:hypothetical protein
MAPIENRGTIIRQLITTALGSDEDIADDDLIERAQMCITAAASIIAVVEDDAAFEQAIAKFSVVEQAVQRELRAAMDRLTDDDLATDASYAAAIVREHAIIMAAAKEQERRDRSSKH